MVLGAHTLLTEVLLNPGFMLFWIAFVGALGAAGGGHSNDKEGAGADDICGAGEGDGIVGP